MDRKSPSHLSNSVWEFRSKLAAGDVKLPANEWILIVDDEFDIMSIFKQALKKKGFHVFGFTDPLLALEHFQINIKRYGLVISDLRMPGMNGYEFVKKVNEIKPEIKIFLMTAFEIKDAEFKPIKITVVKYYLSNCHILFTGRALALFIDLDC